MLNNRFRANDDTSSCFAAVRNHQGFKYGDAWLKRFGPDATLEDVSKSISSDPIVPVQWAHWLLKNFGKDFDESIRSHMIEKIRKHEGQEMAAFILWRDSEWLTDEEDSILESIWRNNLPMVEKELKRGLHSRAKVIGDN